MNRRVRFLTALLALTGLTALFAESLVAMTCMPGSAVEESMAGSAMPDGMHDPGPASSQYGIGNSNAISLHTGGQFMRGTGLFAGCTVGRTCSRAGQGSRTDRRRRRIARVHHPYPLPPPASVTLLPSIRPVVKP